MADALEQLSLQRAVVLAFEDLHWSDPSTITLLDLLARRTERARLLIVVTHRPVAILPSEHPLRFLVQELAGRYCEDLPVPPLTTSEVAEYLGNRIEPPAASDSVSLDRWRVRSALIGSEKRASLRDVIDGPIESYQPTSLR
jgi:predicted ATPase